MTTGPIVGRIMLVAFEGWNDAGEAASSAVRRVVEACELEPFDEIEPDEFLDFTFARPVVRRLEDGTRALSWPATIAYAPTRSSVRTTIVDDLDLSVSTGADGELFALLGAEPSRNWLDFAEQAVDIAKQCEVDAIVFVGAMLADVPHTRPTPTSVTSESTSLRHRLGIGQSEYEGPTGIMSVMAMAAEEAGLQTASVWASVPHYVHATHVPKATIALLDRITELLDITVPLGDLPRQAGEWETGVDELAERDDDMRAYIGHLEQQRDTVESPEASGEALAKEFQRFLETQAPEDAEADADADVPEPSADASAQSDDDAPSQDDAVDDADPDARADRDGDDQAPPSPV